MGNVAERLKNERERLKLTQEQLGAVGGVTKLSQFNYENGKRTPDANYLSEVAKVGVDILYVILGEQANTTINEEELLLLQKFRNADPAVRQFMLHGGSNVGQQFTGSISGGEFKVEMK
ncbi:helix-turn-helix domain-containing protein [Actinobacillus porcinus]|uniref:helix-turn-helix domain-containing protein n=1 Tax=Actinobacillus porcinus TaxID=51048 RepID=UPI0023F37376|nr:helix-turn-helix transcriptional regulator [Actinobacillus porcinus]MDD7545201.1 helix-turn-helix transcriptional regulator [Actinobacillus porcinus]MDY5847141.1 helix-turn-helix transcriptional regulator [Actinobacillus porcinus]